MSRRVAVPLYRIEMVEYREWYFRECPGGNFALREGTFIAFNFHTYNDVDYIQLMGVDQFAGALVPVQFVRECE